MADLLYTRSAEKRWVRISTKYTASYCFRPHASYIRQDCGHPEMDFFNDPKFAKFKSSLNAEMTRLQAAGLGSKKKQAEPLTLEEEAVLWKKKILGDHNPKALLNAIMFMTGLYFALRSGAEHHQLQHKPCQIQLVENAGERAHLVYKEDISKNFPGGLKGRKHKPKVVVRYANTENPDRCFVRLFKKYCSVCPVNRPDDAFYLTPLTRYSEKCWCKLLLGTTS